VANLDGTRLASDVGAASVTPEVSARSERRHVV